MKLHGLGWPLCLAALLTLGATACRSPREDVSRRMDDLRFQWKTNLAHQSNLPERVLDWPSAVELLKKQNLKIRQAGIDLTNSREAVRQIFRDLTPTLNFRSGISRSIEDLATTTWDDVTVSADSFFNVPGLINFGARLYTARLFELRAETALHLIEREQMIELYRVFWGAQGARLQLDHLENQKVTARAYYQVDAFTAQQRLTELEVASLAAEQELDTLQQRASELLGSRAYRWVLVTNGLPDLAYDRFPLPLDDTNRIAQLQMKLAAIELEAARAQLRGIKLRYWPELNIFVSGPAIYQRSGGMERFWDANQIRASADLFWYLDTRGQISRQVRQVERQQMLQRERLKQESLALMDRLLFTQSLLQSVKFQLRQVELQLELLRAVPPANNYAALEKYATEYQSLVDQQQALRRELAELNTLFWFVDEQAWSKVGASPPDGAPSSSS